MWGRFFRRSLGRTGDPAWRATHAGSVREKVFTLRPFSRVVLFSLAAALPLSGLNRPAVAPSSEPALQLEHTPIAQFSRGASIEIRVHIRGEADGVNFFFRYPGITDFQVRPLDKVEAGQFVLNFDTSLLAAPSFEYFLQAWKGEIKLSSPPQAPKDLYAAVGQGEAPPVVPQNIPEPQAEAAKFKFPVNFTANGMGLISRKIVREGATGSQGSGNVRVAVQARPSNRWGLNLDSNFALTTAALPGYKALNLSNLMITLASGNHLLKAGDLNLNESEYTVFGLGRRGFDYTFDNQTLYVRAFTVSTQQVTGFAGFGFPGPQARIYGTAAGYKFIKDALAFKLVFAGGKDNPAQAVNVGVPTSSTAREGSVIGLAEETHLFQQSLNFNAEFASSRYDADLNDETPPAADVAYQVGGDFRWGGFTGGARYRYVGRDFNSIGLAYIASDRKGLEASLGYAKGIVNLQGIYARDQDNSRDDSSRPTTKNRNAQALLMLNISSKLIFNGGYRRSDQATVAAGPVVFIQDGLTNEFTAGLSWMPSVAVSMNGTVIESKISSRNNPGMNTRALTLNAGGCFRAGERFLASPSVSWSRSELTVTAARTDSKNANLTMEFWMVRQVFSAAFYGSGSRTEMPGAGPSDLLDLTAALNFQAGSVIRLGTTTISLRGNYNRQKYGDQDVTDVRVFIQGDLAF